jgi:hypothetical protein
MSEDIGFSEKSETPELPAAENTGMSLPLGSIVTYTNSRGQDKCALVVATAENTSPGTRLQVAPGTVNIEVHSPMGKTYHRDGLVVTASKALQSVRAKPGIPATAEVPA